MSDEDVVKFEPYRQMNLEETAQELGYVFNKAYWGKGDAKESCAAVIESAFSKGIHRIYAECDPENPASWHLLESLERYFCVFFVIYILNSNAPCAGSVQGVFSALRIFHFSE